MQWYSHFMSFHHEVFTGARPLSALDVGEAGATDEQWESATGQPLLRVQWCNNGATWE